MPKIPVDFTKVQDTSKPVPEDAYPTIIKKIEVKTSNEKGKYPALNIQFEITDGPYAGRRLFGWFTTDPSETKNGSSKNFMLFNLCRELRLVRNKEDMTEIDTDDLVNKEVICVAEIVKTVKTDEDTGMEEDLEQNRISKFKGI